MERLLERSQSVSAGQTLDCDDLGAVGLCGEEEARAHGHSVEAHRARTADAVLAADVRPGEAEAVSEEVREEEPRLDVLDVATAVHGDVDGDHARPLRGPRDGAIDEDAHEVPEVFGRCMDGAPRLDLRCAPTRRVARGSTSSTVGTGVTAPTTTRSSPRTCEQQPCRGRSRRRAVRARRRRTRRRRRAAAKRSRPGARPARARSCTGRGRALGGYLATAASRHRDRGASGRDERKRELGGCVGVCDRAAHRSPVAGDGVADVGEAGCEQSEARALADRPGGRARRPGEPPFVANVVEPATIHVDEKGRTENPHVQRRHEALPAGEHLRFVALGQQRTGPRRPTPARTYSNGAGFTRWSSSQRAPASTELDVVAAERVGDGVRDRRGDAHRVPSPRPFAPSG